MQNSTLNEAVIINLRLGDDEFGSFEDREMSYEIEDRLEEALESFDYTEYDGHEFGQGYCRFYLYCRDAKHTTERLAPQLYSMNLPKGSYVIQRFGPPGAAQTRIDF